MINKQWLDSLSEEEKVNAIARYLIGHTNSPNNVCLLLAFLEWLSQEHIEKLELCPFKCEGCSREPHILTKNCVGTTPVYSVTVDTDNTCFIMSDNFKHKAEAITAWNKAVRGE